MNIVIAMSTTIGTGTCPCPSVCIDTDASPVSKFLLLLLFRRAYAHVQTICSCKPVANIHTHSLQPHSVADDHDLNISVPVAMTMMKVPIPMTDHHCTSTMTTSIVMAPTFDIKYLSTHVLVTLINLLCTLLSFYSMVS